MSDIKRHLVPWADMIEILPTDPACQDEDEEIVVLAADHDVTAKRLAEAEALLRECLEEVDFEATNCELLSAGISIFLDGPAVQQSPPPSKGKP